MIDKNAHCTFDSHFVEKEGISCFGCLSQFAGIVLHEFEYHASQFPLVFHFFVL
jgi:hypothetical protein